MFCTNTTLCNTHSPLFVTHTYLDALLNVLEEVYVFLWCWSAPCEGLRAISAEDHSRHIGAAAVLGARKESFRQVRGDLAQAVDQDMQVHALCLVYLRIALLVVHVAHLQKACLSQSL